MTDTLERLAAAHKAMEGGGDNEAIQFYRIARHAFPSILAKAKAQEEEIERLNKTIKDLSDELDMRETEDCMAETEMLEDRKDIARLQSIIDRQKRHVDCAVHLGLSLETICKLDGSLDLDANHTHRRTAEKIARELVAEAIADEALERP